MRILVLRVVVQVQDKRKLLGVRAERVGAILTGRTVTVDAVTADSSANKAKEVGIILGRNRVSNDTLKRTRHATANLFIRSRRKGSVGLPVRKSRGRASALDSVGGSKGSRVDTRGVDSVNLAGVGVKVGKSGNIAIGFNGNETVIVNLFKVHVNNATGPNVGHVGAVEGRNIIKLTGLDNVATVFRKEDGDSVVCKFLSAGLVTRGDKVNGGTTPFVNVETVKVGNLIRRTTVEVVGQVVASSSVIVGGVTDRDVTVALGGDVGLHVTNGGLDKGRGISVGNVVGDFVTSKETEDVGVALELVNDRGVSVKEINVPRRRSTVDGEARGGEVGENVDAVFGKEVDTVVVVQGGVDGVNTNDVCFELQEVGKIALAGSTVSKRVREEGAGRGVGAVLLVRDTLEVELGAVVRVEELVALDFERRSNGVGGGGGRGSSTRSSADGG